MKKLLLAASLAFSATALAGPIPLAGGVSVPDPATPNATTGTGNILTSVNFIQYFVDGNGDLVNLEDELTTDFNDLIGLELNGYGLLDSSGAAGKFLCPSCSLAFKFGGLEVISQDIPNPFAAFPGQPASFPGLGLSPSFNPANQDNESFIDVYIIDEFTEILSEELIAPGALALNQPAADDFIDELGDTLFLSGFFSELAYSADLTTQNSTANLYYGGLLEGTLTAGIEIDGGIAEDNIVSDSVTQSNLSGFFDAVAFSLSSTFISINDEVVSVSQGNDGNFSANVVPAPATIGMLGMALLWLGVSRRRK